MCKAEACERSFAVATAALKACGTSNTGNRGVIARSLRDLSMGLVQAFPAERGKIEAAKMAIEIGEQAQFGVKR
jgi:hypothetical protein